MRRVTKCSVTMANTNSGRGRRRTARRAEERALRKQGERAERRGRAVPTTVAGFEAALDARGVDGVAEALISRGNQRMQRMIDVGTIMQQVVLPIMASYLPLSASTAELGASIGRLPAHPGRDWPEHLDWGLDSAAAAVRLLLSLQPVGAAILARTQLERWSSNIEFNISLPRQDGENTAEWLNRLWSAPDVGAPTGSAQVGDLFADLSELLHGRGPLMPLVWLDVVDVGAVPTSEHIRSLGTIADAVEVSLTRLRVLLAAEAASRERVGFAQVINAVPIVRPIQCLAEDLRPLLWPMAPMHFQNPVVDGQLSSWATGYMRVSTALRTGREPRESHELWPVLGFGTHRYRAHVWARKAYEVEREVLGEEFGQMPIENVSVEATLAGEMAAILARWLREPGAENLSVAAAFAVCASGLRSAQWLWLEDDWRAMGCLRCVVEQLARARTWRTKPAKAAKLEASSDSTPRDWIEGAGWRRLSLLNRALGEFAHGFTGSSWKLAGGALVALQHHADSDPVAQNTGRTHALLVAITLVQAECAAWTDQISELVGEAYRRVARITDEQVEKAMEDLMNRAWNKRGLPLRARPVFAPEEA